MFDRNSWWGSWQIWLMASRGTAPTPAPACRWAGAILAPTQSGAGRLRRSSLLPHVPCPTAFDLVSNETDGRCTATSIRRFQSSAVLVYLGLSRFSAYRHRQVCLPLPRRPAIRLGLVAGLMSFSAGCLLFIGTKAVAKPKSVFPLIPFILALSKPGSIGPNNPSPRRRCIIGVMGYQNHRQPLGTGAVQHELANLVAQGQVQPREGFIQQ